MSCHVRLLFVVLLSEVAMVVIFGDGSDFLDHASF